MGEEMWETILNQVLRNTMKLGDLFRKISYLFSL